MNAGHGGASLEERAELEALRARADRTGQEAARTLAELAGRLAEARDPQVMARTLAAQARRGAALAVRGVRGNLAGGVRGKLADHRGAKRAVLVAIPALGMVTAAVVARRRGWVPPDLSMLNRYRYGKGRALRPGRRAYPHTSRRRACSHAWR